MKKLSDADRREHVVSVRLSSAMFGKITAEIERYSPRISRSAYIEHILREHLSSSGGVEKSGEKSK